MFCVYLWSLGTGSNGNCLWHLKHYSIYSHILHNILLETKKHKQDISKLKCLEVKNKDLELKWNMMHWEIHNKILIYLASSSLSWL